MKRMFRKNQIIITALAVLIAIAGYLKYAGDGGNTGLKVANNEVETGDEPGDAIMVSTNTAMDTMINAKLQREQIRAQSKDELMAIVNNVELTEVEKQSAVEKIVELNDIAEKELAAETLIMSKGIENVVVNMIDENVEVILGMESLEPATKVQVEDIVKRKFDVESANITISLVKDLDKDLNKDEK